jgi:hypothetical protein
MGTEAHFGAAFSLGVRQAVAREAEAKDWVVRHNIHVGSKGSAQGGYSDLLARSVFCLVLQGEGFTTRFDDAILHGCIPVVVINETVGPWGAEMDWEAFSIRISPTDIPKIPKILKAVPQSTVASMQARLADIWHRFAWLSHPLLAKEVIETHRWSAERVQQPPASRRVLKQHRQASTTPAPTLNLERIQQDAFHSLLQLLGSWVPRTGAQAARLAVKQSRSSSTAGNGVQQQQTAAGHGKSGPTDQTDDAGQKQHQADRQQQGPTQQTQQPQEQQRQQQQQQ